MGETVLTPDQRIALDMVGGNEVLRTTFYLSGGTALAEFYLRHRYSEDLDFFTSSNEFPQLAVEEFVATLRQRLLADEVIYRRLHDRRIFFFRKGEGELKVEFTRYPFAQLRTSQYHYGIAVDSLYDIAANKLMALMDRIESKDFIDLYFIFREAAVSLDDLLAAARQKFGVTVDPLALGSEFAKIRGIESLPRMIKPLDVATLKEFFTELAKSLGPRMFSA